MKLNCAATQLNTTYKKTKQKGDFLMIVEKTEFGVLISYEDWEEIQEKLNNSTASQNDEELKKENDSLREVLSGITSFLSEESV